MHPQKTPRPSSPAPRTSRPRNGLTLIELLVVIAVIAILAVILLPLGASITRRATETKCAATLRTWYSVISLYAQDHSGSYVIRPADTSKDGWASAAANKGAPYLDYFDNAEMLLRSRMSPLAPEGSRGVSYILAWLPNEAGAYPPYSDIPLHTAGGNPSQRILMSYSIVHGGGTASSQGFDRMKQFIEPVFETDKFAQENGINVLFADGRVRKARWQASGENDPDSFLSQKDNWFITKD